MLNNEIVRFDRLLEQKSFFSLQTNRDEIRFDFSIG